MSHNHTTIGAEWCDLFICTFVGCCGWWDPFQTFNTSVSTSFPSTLASASCSPEQLLRQRQEEWDTFCQQTPTWTLTQPQLSIHLGAGDCCLPGPLPHIPSLKPPLWFPLLCSKAWARCSFRPLLKTPKSF